MISTTMLSTRGNAFFRERVTAQSLTETAWPTHPSEIFISSPATAADIAPGHWITVPSHTSMQNSRQLKIRPPNIFPTLAREYVCTQWTLPRSDFRVKIFPPPNITSLPIRHLMDAGYRFSPFNGSHHALPPKFHPSQMTVTSIPLPVNSMRPSRFIHPHPTSSTFAPDIHNIQWKRTAFTSGSSDTTCVADCHLSGHNDNFSLLVTAPSIPMGISISPFQFLRTRSQYHSRPSSATYDPRIAIPSHNIRFATYSLSLSLSLSLSRPILDSRGSLYLNG